MKPGCAFYVFPNIRNTGYTSEEFSKIVLEKANVVTCPGNYFGTAAEGYVRFCFANSQSNIEEALDRIGSILI